MRRRHLLALAALAPAAARAQAPLAVVASFSILADMTARIGGTAVAVRAIAGPDTDAHAFQPRPSDARAIRDAAVLVRNGLGFDPWFDRLARNAGGTPARVTATDGITPLAMDGHGHDHGGAERRRAHGVGPNRVADPHCWQDLRLAQAYATTIGAGLAAADPARAEAFRAGAAAYAARLGALDAEVRAAIATVPEARRKVVTAHDAFGYFAAAYGVTFLAPQGIATNAEPSAAAVARLIRQIRADGITAVFVESLEAPAILDRLAREAGVRIRGRLFADSLSGPDGPAPDFEAMVRHNLRLLVPAMRGDQA